MLDQDKLEDLRQAMKLLCLPGHCISIELEELQQVLSLLPVPGLLLGRQGVIRHKQRVGATAWQENISHFCALKIRISTCSFGNRRLA